MIKIYPSWNLGKLRKFSGNLINIETLVFLGSVGTDSIADMLPPVLHRLRCMHAFTPTHIHVLEFQHKTDRDNIYTTTMP